MKMLSFVSTLFTCLFIFGGAHRALADSCVTTTCHSAIAAFKKPHEPVKGGECSSCHTQRGKEHPVKGAKSFELAAKGAALCANCHAGMGAKKFQHAPVKEGDCVSCHKPHGSNERYLLEVGEDRTALCLNCHDPASFKEKYMHGPAAVGACNDCHEAHESSEKKLLKGSVREVCLKCHADFGAAMKESAFVHPPVRDSACTACHKPHGSPYSMFLNNKMPDVCTGCHKPIGVHMAKVKVPHKPLLDKAGCANCHSAHYSKAKMLLAADEMTVCLTCHGRDLGALKNVKKQIEGKKYLHGPLQQGKCSACHNPHGSDSFRMLPGPYPAELYAPYKEGAYDGCLKCHEKNLLRFADTTVYTGFRNGNRNLHFVHVASRKGRTCRLCHEPHASTGEKLISKEGSKFGDWKIPINFKITPTGGSCAPGCHREFKYDRNKPESYQ